MKLNQQEINQLLINNQQKFFGSFGQLDIIVMILQIYNCRSIEVLNAKWKDFYPGKFLILHGSKQSMNVIIRDRELLKLIDSLPKISSEFIFPSITYRRLHRYIRSHYSHLFKKYKTKKNKKVTHGFRYLNVAPVANETEVRDILHHKSTKSGKYYKPK